MEQKRNHRSYRRHGEYEELQIASFQEDHGEDRACRHGEHREQTVHAVDEIQSVDDADHGEYRQRNAHGGRQGTEPPQSVKIIEREPVYIYQYKYDRDLHCEPHQWRDVHHIVHRTDIHHQQHAAENDEQRRAIDYGTSTYDAEHYAEKDADTAEDGDGTDLEFAGIGIIDEVLHPREPHERRVDNRRSDARDAERDQCDKKESHLRYN